MILLARMVTLGMILSMWLFMGVVLAEGPVTELTGDGIHDVAAELQAIVDRGDGAIRLKRGVSSIHAV